MASISLDTIGRLPERPEARYPCNLGLARPRYEEVNLLALIRGYSPVIGR